MTPIAKTGIVGCVLAGGRSSRMGGGDKGLLPFAGSTMIERAIDRLKGSVDALVVNANGDPVRFAHLGLPVVPDPVEGYAGPLAGVLAGLDFAAAHHPEARFVVTAAADTPFFPETLVESLADAAATDETVVLAASDDGKHPVFGLWPVKLREDLRAFLADGSTRKVLAWVDRHPNAVVRFPPIRVGERVVDPFLNVNTPEELAAAEAMAADVDAQGFARPVVIGVAGWKNAGKTTLATRLISELTRRGLKVASVKHAHHGFDVDHPGTDSFRHREAGAVQTAIVSARRVAILQELARPEDEPALRDILDRLAPSDVVVVEGFKGEPIDKIEVRRREALRHDPFHPGDPRVVAIAADEPAEATVPVFHLDDIGAMADFILTRKGRRP